MPIRGTLYDHQPERRALRDADAKTARAWALKETAMDMHLYQREHAAHAVFERCHK